MPPLVYLDTARLGQMTPAAQSAQHDFVRLVAEAPSSLYFENFLRHGYEAWPSCYQQRFPGLKTWQGIAALKAGLSRLFSAVSERRMLLASRSLALVQLASRRMFRVCRNVLTTDLSWPTYQTIVEQRAKRSGRLVTSLPLRERILTEGWNERAVIDYVAEVFDASRCDGLFLPIVDHLGIHLPIRQIVQQIKRHRELRFCFLDAAQAFCHVPLEDCVDVADFIVAGTHKWLGAYLPMGIGLCKEDDDCIRQNEFDLTDDPLFAFTEQLETGTLQGHDETVNLTSLFACAGAVADQSPFIHFEPAPLRQWLQLRDEFPKHFADWQAVVPAANMQTRILLMESKRAAQQHLSPDELRQQWLEQGLIVTTYAGGRARLAFPRARFPVECLTRSSA